MVLFGHSLMSRKKNAIQGDFICQSVTQQQQQQLKHLSHFCEIRGSCSLQKVTSDHGLRENRLSGSHTLVKGENE
jgi:hypothetical protein